MKLILHVFILFLLTGTTASCQKKLQSIKISYLQPYCGGARPTPEMEAEAQKPKPYAHKTVIIVSENGKVDSVKSNEAGIIKKKLIAGKYKLYESWRYYKSTQTGDPLSEFDKSCLEEEWKRYFMEVTVTKSKLTQKSDNPIILNCSWDAPCMLETHKVPKRPE